MINTALRVPRCDSEMAKRLGALWDATEGHWFVPEGHDTAPFAMWLPLEVAQGGPRISVDVVLFPEHCYRCDANTAPVIGVWFERHLLDGHGYGMLEESGGWFLPYAETSADVIATACPDELLAAHGAGPLRWRITRICPDGYLANTCQRCGAVLGNWPLHEAIVEYQAEGGTLTELPHVARDLAQEALCLI
jgi:Domain of unknown function (DUF5710)